MTTDAAADFYVYVLFRDTGLPFYVGKGRGDRLASHERSARRGARGRRFEIIREMQARGIETIKVKLHEGLTEVVAHEYEIALITAIGRGRSGLLINQTDGGEGVTGLHHAQMARSLISAAHRGREKSAEERANIAAGKRGSKASAEARANMSNAQCGKTLSAETRAKMSAAHRGKQHSPEHIEKLAASRRGKQFSPEWRAKLSAAHRGRKQTPEHIENAAAGRRGKKQSPEHVAKRTRANLGRKHSAEARANMSAAHLGKKQPRVAPAPVAQTY